MRPTLLFLLLGLSAAAEDGARAGQTPPPAFQLAQAGMHIIDPSAVLPPVRGDLTTQNRWNRPGQLCSPGRRSGTGLHVPIGRRGNCQYR
jgi:hypothetical protein